jgi:SAM-dependent methyltransferase
VIVPDTVPRHERSIRDGPGLMVDWGGGRYEMTAAELEPAAVHVVALAGLDAGERVLDVACGTGNAALLAARAGAETTGLDAAERLIEVARERAQAEGLSAQFDVGDAQALPYEDGTFDVVLSVFGVIFAPDAQRAFAEMVRVLRPGGRGLISAWVPEGTIDAMVGTYMRAAAAMTGQAPERFPWHDPDAVGDLAARHGATVSAADGEVAFTAESPEAYLAATEEHHPMSVAMRPLIERGGGGEAIREQALAILREGNEDPAGFRATSRYRVLTVRN